jgi:DNA-damage-inducible protein D
VKSETRIALFQESEIRKVIYQDEWWFAIEDVIFALTDSINPKEYLKKIRKRDSELKQGWGQFVHPLSIITKGGPQKLNCSNTKGLLRLIQSVPSPKAEPFKLWLAQVGYERIQEIENPELAQERMKQIFEQKGYPQDWVDKRLRGIAIRQNLTDEWKKRGIINAKEYAILTAEISKATFGITPSQYKKLKNLKTKNQNLRDHMTDLELIFCMLGERVTTEISQKVKPKNFVENKVVASRGGKVAGRARIDTEKELGKSIITSSPFVRN